uniref:Uncharacterized protein n=1 Tax=Cucumis melo TaxID=3656 RepID=A0A9I9E9Y2_CUCME
MPFGVITYECFDELSRITPYDDVLVTFQGSLAMIKKVCLRIRLMLMFTIMLRCSYNFDKKVNNLHNGSSKYKKRMANDQKDM